MTVINPGAEELSPGQTGGLSLGHVGPPPYRSSWQGWEGPAEQGFRFRWRNWG